MCGINGIFGVDDLSSMRGALANMNSKMAHRGPDADGVFADGPILLGHRRLSIIDLDPRGNQPMNSGCGRFIIVFNGEIYNFQKLKTMVSDYDFKSLTDTEVLLALYKKMGSAMLELLEGMFAIAIWDKDLQQLFLARDRFGKKPLYFWKSDSVLVFSSEIRSVIASGLFTPKLNHAKLSQYIQYQTVFDPFTLVHEVYQLEAGCFAIVGISNTKTINWETNQYYDRKEEMGREHKVSNYDQAVKKTRELFDEAVQKRLIADVDFGAFLSGGIDSSSVVAVMSKHLTNPVKTFHIHFDESEFSELRYAEMVAKKYRTDHQNILIQPSAFLDEVIPAIEAIDHPSADGVNTYVVSKYTRAAGIKMALSGLGGDEVFAGYDVFKRLSQIQKLRGMGLLQLWEMLPMSLRSLPFLKGKMREILALERVDVASGYELFRQLFSKGELAKYGLNVNFYASWSFELEKNHLFAWIGNEEVERYMKPVLLRDTDQMSMAHSLEVRVPFLDHKLTDFVMGLPDQWKPIQPGKRLLIDAMGDDLPREIWDRKKMGFVFPWKRWVNQDLKSLVDEGLAVVAEIPSLSAIVADLRRTQIGEENPSWYKVWLFSTLGHWIKNNHIQCN